jgi:hypothetical protein
MALHPVRSDLYPPNRCKTFALPVVTSPTTLHTAGTAGSPADVNHLPSTVYLNVTTGGTFVFTDVLGTSNTITFAAGTYVLPFTCTTVTTGTAVGTMTVSWHPEP